MKARILLSLTLALAGFMLVHAAALDSRRLVRSSKEEATLSLTLVCSLEGVFQAEECVFYFRAPRDTADLGAFETTHKSADGGGGGFGFMATADPRATLVEVEISTSWASKNARGKSALTLATPYFEEKKGKEAGFSYSLVWRKLK